MKFIVSIDIEIIMSIDTITLVHVDMKKETYMKVIVSIDLKIIIPPHHILVSSAAKHWVRDSHDATSTLNTEGESSQVRVFSASSCVGGPL